MNTKRIGYMIIAALFGAELTWIATHVERVPAWLFWAALPFATLRLARTVSFNGIGDIIRAPFTMVVPDSSGAGDSVEPRPGKWEALGELLACPICSGTHAALLQVALYLTLPALGLALTIPLGAAGVSELLHWWAEAQEWKGRAAREEAGTQWLRKNTPAPRWAVAEVKEFDYTHRLEEVCDGRDLAPQETRER